MIELYRGSISGSISTLTGVLCDSQIIWAIPPLKLFASSVLGVWLTHLASIVGLHSKAPIAVPPRGKWSILTRRSSFCLLIL
jgi:hypothetical protein